MNTKSMVTLLFFGCLPDQRTVACDAPEADLCTEWTLHVTKKREGLACSSSSEQVDACPGGALGTCTVQSRDNDDSWVIHYYSDNGGFDAASAQADCGLEPTGTWTLADE